MLTGCESITSKSGNSPEFEAIAAVNETITKLSCDISDAWLVPCEWPEQAPDDDPKTILINHGQIMVLFEECFLLHNGLIKELNAR